MNFLKSIINLIARAPQSSSSWEWNKINTNNLKFPKKFLWGTAVSEYQVSGAEFCSNAQWADWEKKLEPSGSAAEMSKNFFNDIMLMKDLGINSFRFSVEWSRIEPEEGFFEIDEINRYREQCLALKEAGINPMITLHHFTHPKWFEERGGFEKEENIDCFVRFTKFVFFHLNDLVELWCTINEPTVLVLMGYMIGEFPPGKISFKSAAEVMKNLLIAHCHVYQELKKMPGGEDAQIGLVHQYLKFESYQRWNPIVNLPCSIFNQNLHELVMKFLKEGKFEFHIPFLAKLSFDYPQAVNSYDFIGLNYYSRAVIKMQASIKSPLGPTCYEDEIMTDMPYAMHPEGLYQAIADCAALGKPVYITENGIADKKDEHRELFFKRHLYVLSKAIEDGFDVRGYFYWSLIDNYEWAEGWKMKFGLYSFDPQSKERTLKQGAHIYRDVISQSS